MSGPIPDWELATFSRRAANAASGAECAYGHGIEVLPEWESMFAGVKYNTSEPAVAGDVVTEPCNLFFKRRTLYQTPVKYSSSTLQKSKIAWCKKFRYHTKEAA